MDFLSKGTRRSVNLSAFLQQVLKAEQCNFLGENQSGTGANPKNLFHPCPSVKRNSKQQTQNLSKWLKMPLLRQKDNKLP